MNPKEWDNPINAAASDDARAQAHMNPIGFGGSEKLHCFGFGFTIPIGATVDGITVTIEGRDGLTIAVISVVRLTKDGTDTATLGDDKGDNEVLEANDSDDTYGGAADDWSASLTATDVNHKNFGVGIILGTGASASQGEIDHVEIAVDYTELVAPTVEIVANDPIATEVGPTTGEFTCTRDATSGGLTVNYTVSGTATHSGGSKDYDEGPLGGTFTFADGVATDTQLITPVDDGDIEENETVVITLTASANYNINFALRQATVTIISDDSATPSVCPRWRYPFRNELRNREFTRCRP